jgi:hypothetical protein
MRKMLSALTIMLLMTGLVVAGTEFTVSKYDPDKKEVTGKEKDSDKEVTYKITDKTKFIKTDKDGGNPTDAKFEDVEKRLKNIKPDSKRPVKFEITVDKDTGAITEAKYAGGKKN